METSGMQIAEPEKRVLPFRDPELSHRVEMKPQDGQPDEDFHIFVSERIMVEIRDYSATKLDREVGGVLLGGHYVDEEVEGAQEFITIDAFVPVRKGESKHASFRFTPEAWTEITVARNEITKEREERGLPEYMMVGWHHTHPTFGIFLSGHDLFIQENYFNLPWQVALVVDPCRKTLGFLRLRERGTRPIRSPFYLIRDA